MLKRFSSFKPLGLLEVPKPPLQTNFLLNSIPRFHASSSEDSTTKSKKPLPTKKERKKESFRKRLIEKNKERAKHLLKEFVHLVVHGSKSAYKDARYMAAVVSSKPKRSYTIEEIRELSRIKRDLTKFVPFYAAVLIPAGELALIPYLFLFPRAMPSYFITETSLKEEKYKYIDNQARAYKVLRQYLLSAMIKAGYDPSVKDPDGMKKFFIENQQKLLPLLQLDEMDSEILRNSSDFLMYEYVEGTFILNLLYKTIVNLPRYTINAAMWIARNSYRAVWTHPFFSHTFKMNFFPFEAIKRQFIKVQLKRQLKVMKHQNLAIILNQFGTLKEETVLDVARERGYYADKEEEARKWLKEEWNKISKDHIDDELFLFWYSVILYEYHS
jgi:hypothetical protein